MKPLTPEEAAYRRADERGLIKIAGGRVQGRDSAAPLQAPSAAGGQNRQVAAISTEEAAYNRTEAPPAFVADVRQTMIDHRLTAQCAAVFLATRQSRQIELAALKQSAVSWQATNGGNLHDAFERVVNGTP